MDSKSLGSRLGNIAEKHREQQEWRKHRMAWKFPTRKNYENWLASQKGEPVSSNENTGSNTNTNVSSTSMDSDGSVRIPNQSRHNKCISGFGGKKYKKVNGKWVACGGKRNTVRSKRRGSKRRGSKRNGSTRRR